MATNGNKKLRYHEEHNTSVVLSWFTLWNKKERKNLFMASQPLLRNRPRKLPK